MTESSSRALLRRFGQFVDQFASCFTRQAQRDTASQYLDALFNDSERKSMQAMHGRLSDPGSYEALQHFITDSPWEAETVWTRLRVLVPVRRGVLALDDTSFPKQGKHSVGVKRQYCGALGKIANCQVAVSTVLLDDHLAWPLTFELYLPQEWDADVARRRRQVPAADRRVVGQLPVVQSRCHLEQHARRGIELGISRDAHARQTGRGSVICAHSLDIF